MVPPGNRGVRSAVPPAGVHRSGCAGGIRPTSGHDGRGLDLDEESGDPERLDADDRDGWQR